MHRRQRRAPERTVRGNKKENKTKTKQRKTKQRRRAVNGCAGHQQRATERAGRSILFCSFLEVDGGRRAALGPRRPFSMRPRDNDETERDARTRPRRAGPQSVGGGTFTLKPARRTMAPAATASRGPANAAVGADRRTATLGADRRRQQRRLQ